MLTFSKVATTLCLLCLCGNREYPGSFENKLEIFLYLKKNDSVEHVYKLS